MINKKNSFKTLILISTLSILLIFSSCSVQEESINETTSLNNNITPYKKPTIVIDEEEEDSPIPESKELSTENINDKNITSTSKLEDFYGKPSVILFGSTGCSHCRSAVPVFKTQVYEKYKNDVNIWINVIDQKKFDVENIPQGFNNNLAFNRITGKVCNYVPSWVVLDKEGKVVLTSCGNEKSMEDMITSINSLI